MNSLTDQQLLRDYAERGSEDAFAELVRRHLDPVFSAALRMVCDVHLAEDVTQGVFVALSQNALQLINRQVLSGWLHRTAQNLAANTVRSDVRRRAREEEAANMNELFSAEPDADWEQIAPQLDAALGGLSETGRDAICLRYFERKSAREMAQCLGMSEEAAQKRVSRAVESLREILAKRGVSVGAGGLVVAISANAVQSAPIWLASAISCAAATVGTVVSVSTAVAATKTIVMTTIQKAFIATAFILAVGAGLYESRRAARLQLQLQEMRDQQSTLTAQNRQTSQGDETAKRLLALTQENERLNGDKAELLKLRGEYARLNRDSQELARLKAAGGNTTPDSTETVMKSWITRVNLLKQRLEQQPNLKIPELQLATEQDWLNASHDTLETDEDYRRALAKLRSTAQGKFASLADPALAQYLTAHDGQFPTDLAQLKPYFNSPVDDAILQRYEIIPSHQLNGIGMGGDWAITTKAPVDEEYDSQLGIGPNGHGGIDYKSLAIQALDPIVRAFGAANSGQEPVDLSQLQPYATTPDQQAALAKAIRLGIPKNMSSVSSSK